LRYGSYQRSSNAAIYEQIAKSKNVLPQHVYEIAHGKKPQTKEDHLIFEELLSMGIIVNR
jgi:hypothetical protein